LDRTLQAPELAIGEHTGKPRAGELPVIAGADSAIPAAATLALIETKDRRAAHSGINAGVSGPHAAAGATEDVEASPVRDGRSHRSLDVGARGEVGRRGRAGHRRDGGESECNLLHLEIPNLGSARALRSIDLMPRTIDASAQNAVAAQAQSQGNGGNAGLG